MKQAIPLLIMTVFASGCGTPQESGPHSGEAAPDFHAIGQEPGWLLDIHHGGSTVFQYDYAQKRLTVETPEPQPLPGSGGTLYRAHGSGHSLRVEIRPTPCTDVMSGKGFSHTVTVTLDDRRFEGCGTRTPQSRSGRPAS